MNKKKKKERKMKTDVDQYEKKKMWDNFFIFEIFMSRD